MFRKTLWLEGLTFFYHSDPQSSAQWKTRLTDEAEDSRTAASQIPYSLFTFNLGTHRQSPGWLSTFPDHIMHTRLCPEVIISSDSNEQVIMWKLNVPLVEHIGEAHKRKLAKYQELVQKLRRGRSESWLKWAAGGSWDAQPVKLWHSLE